MCTRKSDGRFERVIGGSQELIPEPVVLSLIPSPRRCEVSNGLVEKPDSLHELVAESALGLVPGHQPSLTALQLIEPSIQLRAL